MVLSAEETTLSTFSIAWVIQRGRDGARHFHLGGPLEGPVLQQGELSMVCVGLLERDRKNLEGALGGPGKILGGQCPPLAPPLQRGSFKSSKQ